MQDLTLYSKFFFILIFSNIFWTGHWLTCTKQRGFKPIINSINKTVFKLSFALILWKHAYILGLLGIFDYKGFVTQGIPNSRPLS